MKRNPTSAIRSLWSKIIGFLFVVGGVAALSGSALALDLLEQSYQQSKQYDTVVDMGNNKNAVGNDLIRGGTNINLG